MTNIELFEIFKDCKKSRFDNEPNFDLVQESVCSKLDIQESDKLLADIKLVFVDYKNQQDKNRSLVSSSRVIEENVCLLRMNYVKKSKRPLDEVGDRQHLSDYVEATSAKAQDENVSPTKLYAFGLKHKYLQNKKVAKIGKSMFQEDEEAHHPRLHKYPFTFS